MSYNPKNHHRRSIRLKGYDYSQAGAYFITICCQNMLCRFGKITGQMQLNEYGQIAYNEWLKLPERFPNIELDVFQIMPNHMHGIIVLKNVGTAGAGLVPVQNPVQDPARNPVWNPVQDPVQDPDMPIGDKQKIILMDDLGAGASPAPTGTSGTSGTTVGNIVGAYKSLVANGCLEIYKSKNEMMGKLWQRNYYENVIRDKQAYLNISNYIINNPAKWKGDKFYMK